MPDSDQETLFEKYVCIDFLQGKWRVSIGGRIFLENIERRIVFPFAGKLAELEGLGVALYRPIDLEISSK